MTTLASRVLLATLLVPLAAAVYFSVFLVLERSIGDLPAFIWAGIFTAAFAAVYWTLLWRSYVRWTHRRMLWTCLAGPLAFAGAAAISFVAVQRISRFDHTLFTFLACLWTVPLWLAATVFIWRETPAERAQRLKREVAEAPRCLACGYNMTGLYETRCPECGSRFTLEQLLAGQHRETLADTDRTIAS